MKKNIRFFLTAAILCTLTLFAPKVMAEDSIKIIMTTEKAGNIFFGGDTGDFSFRFLNEGYTDYNVTAEFSAVGSDENVVWSKTDSFDIKGLSYTSKTVFIDFDSDIQLYDIYKLKVLLTDSDNGLSYEKSFDFSYVRNNEDKPQNDSFGINTHYSSYDRNSSVINTTMPLLEKTGAALIRDSVPWQQYEPEKGEYKEISDFPFIDAAKNSGLELLLILAYGNTNYTSNIMSIPADGTQRDAFAGYASSLAGKLGDKVKYFELWNEPNISGFNADGASGADYAELAKAVYPAVKDANQESVLIGMATSSSDTSWMQNVKNAGGDAYMDNISFHPYRWFGYPGDYDFIPRLEKVNSFLTDNNLDKHMWLTELGWSTGIYDGQTEPYAEEYEKAMYLVHSYVMSRQFSNIDKYFWYNFICKSADSEDFEGNFGLIANTNAELPYAAKPAYLSAANMNIMLADTEFKGREESEEGTYIYKFSRNSDNADVYVLWTENGSDTVNLAIEKDNAVIYDMYGNSSVADITDGQLTADITLEPVYIEVPESVVTNYEYGEGLIEISGKVPYSEEKQSVSLIVLKPGKTLSDIYAERTAAVAFIDETESSTEGEYLFRFMLKSGTPGVYNAYIMCRNADSCTIIPLDLSKNLQSDISVTVDGKDVRNAEDFQYGSDMSLSYEFTNLSLENIGAYIAAAFYKNDILDDIIGYETSVAAGETLKDVWQIKINSSGCDKVGIYVWDKNEIIPYSEALLF